MQFHMTKKRGRSGKEKVTEEGATEEDATVERHKTKCRFDLSTYALDEEAARALYGSHCEVDFAFNVFRYAPDPMAAIAVFKKIAPRIPDISKGSALKTAIGFLASRTEDEVRKSLKFAEDFGFVPDNFPAYVSVEQILKKISISKANVTANDAISFYLAAASVGNVAFLRALEASSHATTTTRALQRVYARLAGLEMGSEEAVDVFLNETPLGMAIYSGQIETCKFLLKDSKVKVDVKTLCAIAKTLFEATLCDCAPALQSVVLKLYEAIEQR
jgi:hypothetical protein